MNLNNDVIANHNSITPQYMWYFQCLVGKLQNFLVELLSLLLIIRKIMNLMQK